MRENAWSARDEVPGQVPGIKASSAPRTRQTYIMQQEFAHTWITVLRGVILFDTCATVHFPVFLSRDSIRATVPLKQ